MKKEVYKVQKMDKLKWNRRIALFLIYFVIFFLSSTTCYASKNDETLKEQQKEFGISDFIKNSNEYKGEFFENIDISEIMQNAINGKLIILLSLKGFLI